MPDRPYVLLSCAMSLDGRIDDAGPARLVLSNEEDLDRVDGERAASDAILVGAGTVRRDDPRLLVRSPDRRGERTRRGLPASPLRVTLTAGGDLDPGARLFTTGDAGRLVYCRTPVAGALRRRLGEVAEVVGMGDPLDLPGVLRDLAGRGVQRLMVEGGGRTHARFIGGGLADELHLVIAPLLVGDPCAPRWLGEGGLPPTPRGAPSLAGVRQMGDLVLLRYRWPAP